MPSVKLPAWTGLVTLPAPQSSFATHGEILGDLQQQLPQFLPRSSWPNPPISHTNLPTFNARINFDNAAQAAALHQNVNNHYGHLQPMLPFQASGNAQRYRGSEWKSHVAILNELLRRTLPSKASLGEAEVVSLMNICSYGMYDVASFLIPWRLSVPGGAPQPSQPGPAPAASRTTRAGRNLRGAAASTPVSNRPAQIPAVVHRFYDAFQMDLGEGTFHTRTTVPAAQERQAMTRSLEGRRWVVAPVKHGDSVWSMTIFDRANAELYIFDCLEGNREERVEAIVHMWMRFWNWLGFAKSFQYFVPTAQRAAVPSASGYRSILWLFENLRNQVGEPIQVATSNGNPLMPRKDIIVVSQMPRPGINDSGMYIHDALPNTFDSPSNSWVIVARMFNVLLANELGLYGHNDLRGGNNNTLQSLYRVGSAIAAGSSIPLNDYFTASGGPQFVAQKGHSFGPYDANHARAFHLAAAPQGGITIANSSQIYAVPFNQTQAVMWPNGPSYTQAAPVNRAPAISGVVPTNIQPQDDVDTETYREFHVSLDNQQTATQRQPITQPLILSFSNISRYTAADGSLGLRFFLNAGTSGNPSVNTIVDIPLPDDNGQGGAGPSSGGGGGDDDGDSDDNDGGGGGPSQQGGGNQGSPAGTNTNQNTPRSSQGHGNIPVNRAFRVSPSSSGNLSPERSRARGTNALNPTTPSPSRRRLQTPGSGGTQPSSSPAAASNNGEGSSATRPIGRATRKHAREPDDDAAEQSTRPGKRTRLPDGDKPAGSSASPGKADKGKGKAPQAIM
ncbi:hypothetical protein HJFPF1_04701 [Paramyrothecium foliicola]|nr:hypothetical protein HJFPF1_04701 [Paramyrothecium foliicola]